jgi:hypothetical protein
VGWSGDYSTVEAYDPVTDTWTKKTNMPTVRSYLSTSQVNGKIYAIGGGLNTSGVLAKGIVEEYDPFRAPMRLPQGVDAKGKLTTLWGRLKATK